MKTGTSIQYCKNPRHITNNIAAYRRRLTQWRQENPNKALQLDLYRAWRDAKVKG